MREVLPAIRSHGAELVIIGNGRPEHAADFRDAEHVECPLLTDPERNAYTAAKLKRSVMRSIGPRVVGHAIRAWRAGKRQTAVRGDPWQQGGVFVIRPDNTVPFAYVSEEGGDHPDPADVLAALDGGSRGSEQ